MTSTDNMGKLEIDGDSSITRKGRRFVTSFYTKGETQDIFKLLNIKPGETINTMPSVDDYMPKGGLFK